MRDLSNVINEPTASDRISWVEFDLNEKEPDACSSNVDTPQVVITSVDSKSGHPLASLSPSSSLPQSPKPLHDSRSTLTSSTSLQSISAAPTLTPSHSNAHNPLNATSTLSSSFVSDISSNTLSDNPTGKSLLKSTPKPSRPTSTASIGQAPYQNGDLVVSLIPLNRHCAWLTPALFKPEFIPEQLMVSGLRLTVEDYVSAMQTLLNDFRFNLYILFYKRLLAILTAFGFAFLMILLFSGAKGPSLLMGVFFWFMLNSFGFFITLWLKFKINRSLEQCVANVNEQLIRSNLLITVDDRGKISCHKIALTFVYFDITYCVKYLNDMIENEERAQDPAVAINSTIRSLSALEANQRNNLFRPDHMQPPASLIKSDLQVSDIFITGAQLTRVSQRSRYGEKLLLRYSQKYVKQLTRNELGLTTRLHSNGSSEPPIQLSPRHCSTARCPCQYIEEHLKFKPLNRPSLRDLIG